MSTKYKVYWCNIHPGCKYRVDNILTSNKTGLIIYNSCRYYLLENEPDENASINCDYLLCPRVYKEVPDDIQGV